MNNCEICPILATHNDDKDVQIIETEKWRVVLDPNQQFLGKAFVTLLKHKTSLSDLNEADWKDFEVLVKRLESALKISISVKSFQLVVLDEPCCYERPRDACTLARSPTI